MNGKSIRLVFTGGGSGGHIYPLIAVAENLQKWANDSDVNLTITYMGPKDAYSDLFRERGLVVSNISAGKLRRYFSLLNLVDIPKFFIGFFQAIVKLYFIMPDAVFSKGGTGALPVVLAARFYRIPVAIHESDAKPGLTNAVSSHFAQRIFVSFPSAAESFDPRKTEVTGTPVRRELLENQSTKDAARETLGFASSAPLIFIYAGSQGSMKINNCVLENLTALIQETQILHQTGPANFPEVEKLSQAALIGATFKNRYEAMPYLTDNLRDAFIAADLVIARSGGATLFEIAAFGKPAILIPHDEGSNGHQLMNAHDFSRNGAAVVIEEANLVSGIFVNEVKLILADKVLQEKMGEAAKKFFVPDAADRIGEGILRMVI
jgi:UDP-N-acetylglucosamine--N-acetylmuramyl-(pentapeptide) pyrophosphoryl-undecaprenol N-acetylglucosamine transferase